MADVKSVAEWMAAELRREGLLHQTTAASEIADRFGEKFIYYNDNGNPAIDKKVLLHFRKLTEKVAVWNRGERYWRLRESGDEPSRAQP